MTDWAVERFAERAMAFHGRDVPDPARRAVWVAEPTAPALVLGSRQRLDDVTADARIDVAIRRSGGGAVLVVPGDLLWLDVIVPADDRLWDDDVGRSAHWLGEVWAVALAELGVEAVVHTGAMVRTRWSDQVCFAGLGPGEVLTADGRKLVGISQRRTRGSARFQCAALARWDPGIGDLVGVPPSEIVDVAAGVGVPLPALLAAFLQSLPA